MPLNPVSVSILCLLAFCLGVMCARWILARKHLEDRLRLDEEVARRVRSRFQASQRVEEQVLRIVERLDEVESGIRHSLEASHEHLDTLREAVATRRNGRFDRETLDRAGLGWVREYIEESAPAGSAGSNGAATRDDAAAGGELERERAQGQAEAESQAKHIAELTERLRRLEPKSDLTKRLEKEMLLWQDKHQRLERENAVEIATLRAQVEEGKGTVRKLADCERRLETLSAEREQLAGEKDAVIAGLEAHVAELEPNVAELERVRGEVREWQKRCQQELARRETETAELKERIDELEPMESTIEFLWEDKAGLERTISAKDRELEQAAALRQQQMLELTATRESLADLENSHRELGQRHAADTLALKARIQELEPASLRLEDASGRIGELEEALTAERDRAAGFEEEATRARAQAEEHESASQRWRVETEDAGRQLAAWQERYRRLESDKQAEIISLRGHVATLEPLVSRVTNFEKLVVQLETAERTGRQRITELEVESRRLARELESRTVKHDRTAERLADVEHSLVESTVRLRQAEERHSAELSELQGRLQGYASELANAQKAQSELAGRNREQESALHDLNNQVSDGRARATELEQRLAELDQDTQGKSRRITSLMAELDSASQERERVRREADRKRSLVEAAESVLAELRPKLQALEAQLHEKDGSLGFEAQGRTDAT